MNDEQHSGAQNLPRPFGLAIRRLCICQGCTHWLHAAPSLAKFWAAARLAF